MLYGFFEELGAEGQKINETLDCLGNMTILTHDFMQLIEQIKKIDFHHLESLILVFKDLGIFIMELYKENINCFKSMEEIAQMIEELISIGPVKLLERIKTNLQKNMKKIDLELVIMMSDFNNKKYEKMGQDLGILAKYVLFQNSSFLDISMDYNSFYIMVEAILQGLHVNDTKSFITCLQKKPDLYTSMQKIIEMIQKLTPVNYLIYLPIIYHDIKKVYNEKISICVNYSSDLSHDIYIIKNSKYLTDLANLWVNSIPLIKDIKNIKNNHTNPQILGMSIGDIIYEIFILNQNVTLLEGITPDDVEQFVLGFLKGMKVNVTSNITQCLKDSTDVADEVIDIINKVIHLDPANYTQILAIINDLVQVATDILNAIKPCTSSSQDLEWLIKKIIETPYQVVLEHLAKYSLYIVADLGAAAKDALRKMYYLCGTDLGDIIYLLFLKS